MRPLWAFLICLAPAAVGYIFLLVAEGSGDMKDVDRALCTFFYSAPIVGVVAAVFVFRAMAKAESSHAVRWICALIVAPLVAAAYVAMGFVGCVAAANFR